MGTEDLQMHLALKEHVLPAACPYRDKEMETDGEGGMETSRVKLGNTWLCAAEDSRKEVNFNSAAVATNKNPLIEMCVTSVWASKRV